LLTFEQFYNEYKGKPNVGNTAANKGECVGLSSLWMDNFNIPHVYGHAKDLYTNAKTTDFAKIPNSPDAIVQKGDIVVWSAGFNGTYGHTGIATGKADINSFECFEQNDPLGSTPHNKTYNYAYVIGWLRPKKAIVDDYATNLGKMLNWDNIVDYYNAKLLPVGVEKLDNKEPDAYKKVVEQTDKVIKDFEDFRRTSTQEKDKLAGEIRSLEEEVQRVGREREEAVSKICSDPNAHTFGNSGDSDVPTPDADSDNNSSSTADPSQETKTTFFSLVKNFLKELLK